MLSWGTGMDFVKAMTVCIMNHKILNVNALLFLFLICRSCESTSKMGVDPRLTWFPYYLSPVHCSFKELQMGSFIFKMAAKQARVYFRLNLKEWCCRQAQMCCGRVGESKAERFSWSHCRRWAWSKCFVLWSFGRFKNASSHLFVSKICIVLRGGRDRLRLCLK